MPKTKKSSKRESPKPLPETSKTSFEVKLSPAFLESLRKRGRPESRIIGDAIRAAAESWGFPHKHAGTGLRRLTPDIYECRSGLRTRLLFEVFPGILYFFMEGDHDDVQAFLKNR
jgi:hypothetical protein